MSPPPTLVAIISAPDATKWVTQVISAVASAIAARVQNVRERFTRIWLAANSAKRFISNPSLRVLQALVRNEPAIGEGEDAVGHEATFSVVGDEQQCLLIAPVGDLQQLHDIAAGAAVEIACRLVGENESRIVDQRPSQ